MTKILDQIEKENDIKKVKPEDYKRLADEIRRFLVDKISKTGGHLSSNLGVVELTMALHLCMDFPEDKLIWDVGHQAYTHKILTGRKNDFETLRKYEGLSGFPKSKESDCDAFDTGHSSTSISAALGMAKARDLLGDKNKIFAVIGDGALSGGMAYEALNNAARLKSNLVIVLNDNNMSISENVGGMSNYLGKIRTNEAYIELKDDISTSLSKIPKIGKQLVEKIRKSKDSIKRLVIPGMLFEDMGITYIGPINGHNISQLYTAFQNASKMKEAVIVHVVTKKGKGYPLAEKNPSKFHGVDPFFVKTGLPRNEKKNETYTDVFSNTMVQLAKEDKSIVAITAAMPSGTGLMEFARQYPKRFFDVGIAEQHAVTFAAGLAKSGIHPVVAVYSTFLQRAYDQILHDVCVGNLPVVFAIDRAGIVGSDGETHQGIFDLSYLSAMPHMTVISPKNKQEFELMLKYSISFNGPIALRYPRGGVYDDLKEYQSPIEYGKSEVIFEEKNIVLLAVGSMVTTAYSVREKLKAEGYLVTLVNARFVKPIDEELIDRLSTSHQVLVTLEENVKTGGYGQMVAAYCKEKGYNDLKHIPIAIPDEFLVHGEVSLLKKSIGLDTDSIVDTIQQVIRD